MTHYLDEKEPEINKPRLAVFSCGGAVLIMLEVLLFREIGWLTDQELNILIPIILIVSTLGYLVLGFDYSLNGRNEE